MAWWTWNNIIQCEKEHVICAKSILFKSIQRKYRRIFFDKEFSTYILEHKIEDTSINLACNRVANLHVSSSTTSILWPPGLCWLFEFKSFVRGSFQFKKSMCVHDNAFGIGLRSYVFNYTEFLVVLLLISRPKVRFNLCREDYTQDHF